MSISLGDAILYLTGNNTQLNRTLSQTEGMVKSWGGQMAGFFQSAFSFAVGGIIQNGIQGIAQSMMSLPATAFDAIKSNEALNQSFNALVSSQMRVNDSSLSQAQAMQQAIPFAQELRNWVQQLAILSPFDEQGVALAMRTGLAYGFTTEEAQRLTKATIDFATATGQSTATMSRVQEVLGRVSAAGRVQLGDLTALADAGVNVKLVMERMGVSIQDFTKGTVDADAYLEAVISTLEDQFGGAAEDASNTWGGLANSLSDIISIDVRTFFEGIFDALKPLAQQLVATFQNDDLKNSLAEIGQTIGQLIAPAIEYLRQSLEGLPAIFSTVVGFIQQVKDELAGLSAGDIMEQMSAGLAVIQTNLNTTLTTLSTQHVGVVDNLKQQIEQKGVELGEGMAKIAAEYGPKIQEIQERYAKSIAAIHERISRSQEQYEERRAEMIEATNQRLADMEEAHAKSRKKNEDQLQDTIREGEERITEIKADHARKRQQLLMNLLTAETEEQWLNIKAQMDAEDSKSTEQISKTKQDNQAQVQSIKERIAEEDAEYAKQRDRTEKEAQKALGKLDKQHDQEMADLKKSLAEQEAERDKALAKVQQQRAEEEKALQEQYNREVAALQQKIDKENAAYDERVKKAKDAALGQSVDYVEEMNRRAAAIGSGPATEVVAWIKSAQEWFDKLSTSVGNFLTTYAVPLQGFFIGLAAVLAGGAIISALTTIVGLIAGISLPIVGIIAGITLLYTAWTQNWFGIQQTVSAALTFLQPYWDRLTLMFNNFIELLLPRLQEVWNTLTLVWTTQVSPALDQLWAAFGRLLESLGFNIEKSTAMEAVLWLVKAALAGVLLAVELLKPLIEGLGLAVSVASKYISSQIDALSKLKKAFDTIIGSIREAIDAMAEWGQQTIGDPLGAVGNGIKGITDAAKSGVNAIVDWGKSVSGIKTPKVITPGSPTPFEVGLRGITDAIKEMPNLGEVFKAPDLSKMTQGLTGQVQAGQLAAAAKNVTNNAGATVQYQQFNQFPDLGNRFDIGLLLSQSKEQTLQLLHQFYSNKEGKR